MTQMQSWHVARLSHNMRGQKETLNVAKVSFTHPKPNVGSIVHVDRADMFNPEVAKACLAELDARGVIIFPRG